jgi:hypothetical protein
LAVAAIALAGCSAHRVANDEQRVGRPAAVDRVVTRSYEHEIKTDRGVQRQTVEYAWDYSDAVVKERTLGPDGIVAGERDVPGQILRATEQELEWAFDLARSHPDLRKSVTSEGVRLYGGFILMKADDAHCHLRSRCVYVFASQGADGSRKVAEAIVDLQSNRVVYPNYRPDTTDPIQ